MNSSIENILTGIRRWVNGKIEALSYVVASHVNQLAVSKVTVAQTVSSQELQPNTLYVFSSRTSSNALMLTLGAELTGISNEYHFILIVGNSVPTITWPSGISWNGGSAPTIESGTKYEVSILENIATCIEI